ncbi:MAG: histidine phosphatase family protein [Oscillospiraceae bacterium]|nr:histidine phosphatase family protein [Oscillospiraceae bacterium]
MTCYLVRHGQDDETVRGDWSDAGLTGEGKRQAKGLADYIVENKYELRIERLFSSDLPRAVETARFISIALNLEIEPIPEFRETNNGVLAGMSNDIANEKYPGLFWSTLDWNEEYPQGESPHIFYERVKVAWENFSKTIRERNKNVLLVTHQGVINVICSLIDGSIYSNKMEMSKAEYTAIIPLSYSDNAWVRK